MFLSICMPTFNRKEKALKQAANIIGQLNDVEDVEFIVSDNCSTDGTYEALRELCASNTKVKIVRQNKNLGLVGNVHYLFNNSIGRYIWFISDDDTILNDSVSKVMVRISRDKKPYYLLNFKTEFNKEISKDPFWVSKDPKECFKNNWGGFGLVSAEILEKDCFKKVFELTKNNYNLCHPVIYSLYGIFIMGGEIITDDIFLYYSVGPTSWNKYKLEVGSVYNFESVDHIAPLITKDERKFLLNILISNDYIKKCCALYIFKKRDYKFIRYLLKEGLLTKVIANLLKIVIKKGR